MSMVAGFLAKGGRSGPRPQALSAQGMLKRGEWLLTDLARELRMPSATLHRWRKVGWVQARKLPVPGGHWAIWAAAAELKRLTRLRKYQRTARPANSGRVDDTESSKEEVTYQGSLWLQAKQGNFRRSQI